MKIAIITDSVTEALLRAALVKIYPEVEVVTDIEEAVKESVPVAPKIKAPETTDFAAHLDEHFEDYAEEFREVVQIRIPNHQYTEFTPPLELEAWADTNIAPEEIDEQRRLFPEHEYRLVLVVDEGVDEVPGTDQQSYDLTPEDEINMLKAEVVKLRAELASK